MILGTSYKVTHELPEVLMYFGAGYLYLDELLATQCRLLPPVHKPHLHMCRERIKQIHILARCHRYV